MLRMLPVGILNWRGGGLWVLRLYMLRGRSFWMAALAYVWSNNCLERVFFNPTGFSIDRFLDLIWRLALRSNVSTSLSRMGAGCRWFL